MTYLKDTGTTNDSARETVKLGKLTLGSLYRASLSRDAPYSDDLTRLALRFALDPRQEITGDLRRFSWEPNDTGWIIHLRPLNQSVIGTLLPPAEPGRQIKFPTSVQVLNYVLGRPRQLDELRRLIWEILGHEPTKLDELPAPRKQRFTFRIHHNGTVQLWIEKAEVRLPKHQDVHKLLNHLCDEPERKFNSPEIEDVRNLSRAARDVQKAMATVYAPAADWLETDPFGWAKDHSPKRRRGRQDSQQQDT